MKSIDYMIFSDASVGSNKSYKENRVCASSSIVLNVKTGKWAKSADFLGERTINYGELFGIYRGVKMLNKALRKKSGPFNVAVVSDSEVSIKILSQYIKSWDTNAKVWKKVDGSCVKNQDLIKFIYKSFMCKDKYDVKFIHMNSHKTKSDIGKIQNYLKNNYDVWLDKKSVDAFIQLNAMVDADAVKMRKYNVLPKGCTVLKRKRLAECLG